MNQVEMQNEKKQRDLAIHFCKVNKATCCFFGNCQYQKHDP